MEVFVRFINNNIPLVVITAIAVVGILGISAALIVLKVRSKLLKSKTQNAEQDIKAE